MVWDGIDSLEQKTSHVLSGSRKTRGAETDSPFSSETTMPSLLAPLYVSVAIEKLGICSDLILRERGSLSTL